MNKLSKIVSSLVLGTVLFSGIALANDGQEDSFEVMASHQNTSAYLKSGSAASSSGYINGNRNGSLTIKLEGPGGTMKAIVYKVVKWLPDSVVTEMSTSSTESSTLNGIDMTPDTSLYYFTLSSWRGTPEGSGTLRNYPY